MLKNTKINKKNLQKIIKDIQKNSPHPERVKIIAVTKTFSYSAIKSSEKNNIFNIGENKVQETKDKIKDQVKNKHTQIHFIGNLQSNKVNLAISLYDIIQSVDSEKILKKINNAAKKKNKKQKIFLQLKINNEPNQKGANKKEIKKLIKKAQQLSNVKTIGLMSIGPNTKDEKKIIKSFNFAKKTQEEICKIEKNCNRLSLGMSNDYVLALKAGATDLRIGTNLFEKRDEK